MLIPWACAREQPRAPRVVAPPPPPPPLTTAEIQQVVDGAARLNRSCREQESETGLYVIRLMIAPDGRVTEVQPRRGPSREEEPATYSGVARYIEGARDPDTPVVRCLASALGTLRFRRFTGEAVAFDYPVVVENLPPSEPSGDDRRCEADADCVFRPRPPCACDPCGRHWRRAVSRKAAQKQARFWLRQRRRLCRLRQRRPCPPCKEPGETRGKTALCIDGQCSVR